MAQINLLPWREERRQELKQEFIAILVGIALLGGAAVFMADLVIGGQISTQEGRNTYLQQNIDQLNRQVKEIAELERKRQDLLDRMNTISNLQGTRPLIVRMFDETVRTLPDGVYFEKLTRSGASIKVEGIAESNNRVSALMRNLDASTWFSDPNLTGVSASQALGPQSSKFDLSFRVRPTDETTDG